jgi:hypothetical protein
LRAALAVCERQGGLLTEFRGFPSVLAIYMSSQMAEAFEDFTAHHTQPPPDLYERFLGWIRSPLND